MPRSLLLLLLPVLPLAAEPKPYPLFFESAEPFATEIARARKQVRPLDQTVTGLTIPHHLLAADLIADTLQLAANRNPERILLLSPDHFRRSRSPAATTTRPFRTPLGPVPVDQAAVATLLASVHFSESSLFSHEHGVQAVLPFLARFFPDVPVVPVALDIRSRPDQWRPLTDRLRAVVTPRTLVIQSTDFSHYHPQSVAARKDQQTLIALATGDPDMIPALHQPDHLDSKAAQWIQMTLQREAFACTAPVITDNRNAIRYGGRADEPRTTSYITQVYSPDFIPASALPGRAWFFGGDTHFGRHLAHAFADPARARSIREAVLAVTSKAPLVVNLEGVLLDPDPCTARHPMRIGMDATTALAELSQLHVAAAVVANNHTLDFGPGKRATAASLLERHGIRVIDAGPPVDLGPFHLAAATDVVNLPEPRQGVLTAASFAPWRNPARRVPLFAFLHCGTEGTDAPGERERTLATWAEEAGASLVTGCHPHRPSPRFETTPSALRFPSLGNLIFDQLDPRHSAVLLEVRFFEQGTWAARAHRLGNLFARSATRQNQAQLPR